MSGKHAIRVGVVAVCLATLGGWNRLWPVSTTGAQEVDCQGLAHKVPDSSAALDDRFRKSVQPYLISWLNLNPVEALKTNTPVLILQGSSDFELNSDDPRRLSAAPKNVRVVMLPGADHDLKIKAADSKSDHPRPLSPQVASSIQTFLESLRWP